MQNYKLFPPSKYILALNSHFISWIFTYPHLPCSVCELRYLIIHTSSKWFMNRLRAQASVQILMELHWWPLFKAGHLFWSSSLYILTSFYTLRIFHYIMEAQILLRASGEKPSQILYAYEHLVSSSFLQKMLMLKTCWILFSVNPCAL